MTTCRPLRCLTNGMRRFVRDERGQDLIEYGVLGSIIAAGAVFALGTLSGATNDLLNFVLDEFMKAR